MKILNYCLFVFILIFSSNIIFSQSFVYISPKDNSILISLGANIILKSNENIDQSSLSPNEFSVTGSISGVHQGRTKLSDDNKTILFIPNLQFTANEVVSVNVIQGIKTTGGDALPAVKIHFKTTPLIQRININPLSLIGDAKIYKPITVNKVYKSPAKITATNALPSDFPKISVDTSNNPADGKIFLANDNVYFAATYSFGNFIIILNNDGSVVKYKRTDQTAIDFKVQPNGELSYAEIITFNGVFFDVNWILLDTSLTPIDTIQCGNGYTADTHDFRLLPNGHALVFADDPELVDMSQYGGSSSATVIGSVIQELDASKNVVFQWRTWDYLPITDSYFDLTQNIVDLIHGNSLEVDENGNILFSMRHLSSIIKIDRQTGNIDWILGGKQNQYRFLNENASNYPNYFSLQHDARLLPNGDLTLMDNGNQHSPQYSRAVEYKLDEQNKTADLVWEYRHNPDIFNSSMGSVQRLSNGNTLIGWGGASATGSPAATEVHPDNSIALELYLPLGQMSYRVYKFPWTSGLAEANVNLEVLRGNTYKFNTPYDTTGITIKFDSLNFSLKANATVSMYNYAPINPMFALTAPLMVSNYFNIKQQGITSYTGDVQVNLKYYPAITNPKETIVYARSSINSNFFPLATNYDSTKDELTFTTSTLGDFAFGIPQTVDSTYIPVPLFPKDSEIVNEKAPVKLVWGTRGIVQTYHLQISTNSSFTNPVVDNSNLSSTYFTLNTVNSTAVYYWRVNSTNAAGTSYWSNVESFNTASPFIKVLFPNGGEKIYLDSNYIIRWESNISEAVNIDLMNGNNTALVIGDNIFSLTNEYQWHVPSILKPDSTYKITVTSIGNTSLSGLSSSTFAITSYVTSINTINNTVKKYELSQNYPNPFNPSTIINYQIPVSGKVVLKVYNILGAEIATLVNKEQTAGIYNIQFSSDKYHLASGVYLYKIQAGNYISVKKLLLLK